MLLKTRFGLEFSNPSASQIDTALRSLSPGDQLVLVDQELNEVRVFGPLDGSYHVFCSLSREGGPFQAEKDLSSRDTLAILVRFAALDLEWVGDFNEAPPPSSRSRLPAVLLTVVVLILSMLFVWLRLG